MYAVDDTDFINITDLAKEFQALIDLLAIAFVLGCARVVRYLQMLPTLGPMLVAVVATCRHHVVLLYLALIGASLVVFAVAFHISTGVETDTFSTIPKSIVGLTEWMVGEVGTVTGHRALLSPSSLSPLSSSWPLCWSTSSLVS